MNRFFEPKRWVPLIPWILGLGVAAKLVSAVFFGGFEFDDFERRYHSARRLLQGIDPYKLEMLARSSSPPPAGLPTDGVSVGADYFPSALLPMFPLTLLNLKAARFAWLVISLACAAVFARQSFRACGPLEGSICGIEPRTLAIALWISSPSFITHLLLGQNCLFALAFALGAVHFNRIQRPVLAGLCLTLALFKYAYIWPVLLILALDLAWKPLVVSGALHLVTHLIFSQRIGVGPVEVVREVLRLNARVFQRNSTLTFWYPFRTVSEWVPGGIGGAHWLGAAAFLAAVIWVAVWWKRDRLRRHDAAWILVLGNLSTLSIAAKPYQLLYFLPGWLWCFRDWSSPRSRGWRWTFAVALLGMGTLTAYVRRAEISLTKNAEAPLSFHFFNLSLLAACVSSAVLLVRDIRADSAPSLPSSKPTR